MSLDARALEAQRNRLLKALDELVDAYDLVDHEESSVFQRSLARRRLERALEDSRQILSFLKDKRVMAHKLKDGDAK
jgi:hypothetical protein